MTAENTTPKEGQESTDIDREAALSVLRGAAADSLRMRYEDLGDVVRSVERELREGEGPSAEQVRRLRQEVDGVRFVVEEYMAEVSEGSSAWARDGAHRDPEELQEMIDRGRAAAAQDGERGD